MGNKGSWRESEKSRNSVKIEERKRNTPLSLTHTWAIDSRLAGIKAWRADERAGKRREYREASQRNRQLAREKKRKNEKGEKEKRKGKITKRSWK